MTLLANRPVEATESRTAQRSTLWGGTYVSTHAPRPETAGSYVTTGLNGTLPAGATGGRYVSLSHPPMEQAEGRYTDKQN